MRTLAFAAAMLAAGFATTAFAENAVRESQARIDRALAGAAGSRAVAQERAGVFGFETPLGAVSVGAADPGRVDPAAVAGQSDRPSGRKHPPAGR